jgi:hypothetical protein
MTGSDGTVRRRRVFYIPGFDPYPPRRYRELYRKEGAEQARISGYKLGIKGRPGKPGFSWAIKSEIGGEQTLTRYDVLVWHDLVRASMDQSIAGTYVQLLRVAWLYITSGALRRLMWLRKGPVIAALYPIFMLLGQFGLALLAFTVCYLVLGGLVHWVVGAVVGLSAAIWLLVWFRSKDHRFFAYYLMHDYAFTASRSGAYPPTLETRLSDFRARIADALASDVDEVLIVGHSSGAHMAVSILADLDRAGDLPKHGPAIGLLTLGHVVPMVSFLPKAMRLRADLAHVSMCNRLFWLDVTAPGDGCSFALCDPVAVTGVAPDPKHWPIVISAAFTQTLLPETWARLKRRFFRLHFQYLCAFDNPGDYDFFQITAGPLTLARRYRGRAPSKSRIDVPASPYRTTGR